MTIISNKYMYRYASMLYTPPPPPPSVKHTYGYAWYAQVCVNEFKFAYQNLIENDHYQ